jgi:uncharacterized DUF497 family protein
MIIDFDVAKSAKNLVERELPFDSVVDFDWQSASIAVDSRNAYPEQRLVALGYLFGRLHVLCFTPIAGVISLRRANNREVSRYENP